MFRLLYQISLQLIVFLPLLCVSIVQVDGGEAAGKEDHGGHRPPNDPQSRGAGHPDYRVCNQVNFNYLIHQLLTIH